MADDEAALKKRRAEFALVATTTDRWIWVADPEQAFVAAKILQQFDDGSMEVEIASSRDIKVIKKAEVGPFITRLAELKNHVDDMVRMGDVNEATILHNLRARFLEDNVYTNIGTILVSINPFTWIEGLYRSELIQEHLHLLPGEIAAPHVFQIAAAAFHGLRSERTNQAVIISGESGAGKTEATKKCLQFFAEAAGSSDKSSGMENKLLSANPILEAFGNAKTVRNNNSSRFGKWMEVHFNIRAQICGSQIINYLLEKSRVVFQSSGERNFHIFYMLCCAAPPEVRAALHLGSADTYGYTNKSGSIVVEGLDDHEEFHVLMQSFDAVEMKAEESSQMFKLVAGLLHMSNITFEAIDADSCRLTRSSVVEAELGYAAELLGVGRDDLQLALECKLIETRNERVRSPLSAEKAIDGRNSMAKAIYGRQFDWLVQRVNTAMEGSLQDSENVIGVLDIFGFEIFEVNSFEQLCINYCNEKLQQHFNAHVFKAEEKCYKEQGISYDEVRFVDNQDVLDLVELRPNGLLPKLDDECKVPRGSDNGYLDKIVKIHGENPRFRARIRRGNETRENEFGVNHYAGLVSYDVRGFLEKNKDELLLNIKELMQGSSNPFIGTLFSDELAATVAESRNPGLKRQGSSAAESASSGSAGGGGGGGGPKDKLSQAFQFRTQLDKLMGTLNATAPHYIRCVKPNNVKKAHNFDAVICLQQLRYAGVFEAVKIRQQGFPFRWSYELFYKRYRCIGFHNQFRQRINPHATDFKVMTGKLIADIVATAREAGDGKSEAFTVLSSPEVFKLGRTMVLYRADPHRIIEAYRDLTRERSAQIAQRVFRGFRSRKATKKLWAIRERIRGAIRGRDLPTVLLVLAEGEAAPIRIFEMKELGRLAKRLSEEKACRDVLAVLYPFDPVDRYGDYEAVLKETVRLEMTREPLAVSVQTKFDTVKDRIEAKTNLLRGIEVGDKALILASLQKAEALRADWGDIIAPETRAAAADVLLVIEREETLQEGLKGVLSTGGASGSVGCLDTSAIDTSALERVIADALSGRTHVTTIVGRNLITTAQAVRAMRLALRSGDWAAIEASVAAAAALREGRSLAPEAEPEVRQAMAEVADRRIQRVVAIALSQGAPRGRVGELNAKSADVAGLAAAIASARAQAEDVGGLSPPSVHLLVCAELVLRLRVALVAGDWGGIKRSVAEALEMRLPEVAIPEVTLAKDELDNHTLVHHLSDALERGSPSGTVARLDLSVVDVSLLGERIAHADEVGPKTPQAAALLKLARIVRRVRIELLAGNLAALPDLARLAGSIPREFVPQRTIDELLVVQYEGENVLICKLLRSALTTGGAAGLVGNVDAAAVDVSKLTLALKQAAALKCRSDEALWLFSAAKALLAARTAFREGRWDELLPLLLGVSSLDDTKLGKGSSGGGKGGDAAGHAPVLRDRSMSKLSAVANRVIEHNRGGGDSALPGSIPPARSRSTSTELLASTVNVLERARGLSNERSGSGGGVRTSTRRSNASENPLLDAQVTFSLPPPTAAELKLMTDEFNNHSAIKELSGGLHSGAPAGPLGELNASGADVSALSVAIKRAERTGVLTPVAASLLYTARVVRDMRDNLRSGDWAGVEGTLRNIAANNARVVKFVTGAGGSSGGGASGGAGATPASASSTAAAASSSSIPSSIPTSALGRVDVPPYADDPIILEQAAMTLAEAGTPEVVRVEQECRYRAVVAQMIAALESGGARGTVGALDIGPVSTLGLAAAIDASRALGARTDRARHLTSLCRLLWQMRTAVKEGEWPSVESLLSAAGDVLGKSAGVGGPAAAAGGESTLPPGCSVPPAVLAEVELYRSEAHNRRLLATLIRALGEGGPAGDVGRLNLGALSVAPLEAGLRLAVHLGTATGEARCLASTALHLRSMRLALLGGAWDRLGELLDYLHNAADKGKAYSFPGVSTIGAAPAIAPPAAAPSSYPSTNTPDGRGSPAVWPGVVDASLGWDVQTHGVATPALRETALMQLELNNRNIIVHLTAALSRGAAGGTTGHLDLAPLECGALEWALEYASTIGCVTPETTQLHATGHIVRKIRLALGAGDWGKLEAALGDAHGKVLADIGADEIRAAQDELDNRAILTELAGALGRGKPQGRTGRLYTGSIDLKPLNDAIGLAGRLGPKTLEAKQMLFTAKVVARLRLCLLNEDLPEAGLTLEAIRGKLLASVAMPEVRTVQDEVDNWTVLTRLSAALTTHCVGGAPGALDLSAVDTGALEAALELSEELGAPRTMEAANLAAASALVFRLRTALIADRWAGNYGSTVATLALTDSSSSGGGGGDGGLDTVEAVLADARAAGSVSELAAPELALAQGELDNRRTVTLLAAALAAGGARGPVGALDTSAVDIAALDAAITEAGELGIKTAEADRLLNAAKLVRRLRASLAGGGGPKQASGATPNWQWVGSVLLEARSVIHVFPPVSLRELQLAQDELDNRALLAQVTGALRAGAVTGPVGVIDASTIDTAGLDEALAYARSLGIKSEAAGAAVALAGGVRRLRAALKAGDFAGAGDALAAISTPPAQGSSGSSAAVFDVCADELRIARLHVDDHVVVRTLASALANGGAHASGAVGDAQPSRILTSDLDAAIAEATKRGCHTPPARAHMTAALVIRRLRGAFTAGDFVLLKTVVEEAEREVLPLLAKGPASGGASGRPSRALPPSVAEEVEYGAATLRFREVFAGLARALEAGEEPGLIDALAKAAPLALGAHPLPHVRATADAASALLSRVTRVKAALSGAIGGREPGALIDALASAASMGYAHPLVDEARRVLARVEALAARAATALGGLDAVEMAACLREGEAQGVSASALPILGEVRKALSVPRPDFLRKELAAVLTAVKPEPSPSAYAPAPAAGANGEMTVAAGGALRAPTPSELRVIACTLQLKDAFFSDAAPDAATAAAGGGATSPPSSSSSSVASVAGSTTTYGLLATPAAASAAAAMRTQRNIEENVRGGAARSNPPPSLLSAAWALSGAAAGAPAAAAPTAAWGAGLTSPSVSSSSSTGGGGGTSAVFRPGGPGVPAPAGVIGGAVPPSHSRLRRAFDLSRYTRLKPAHMFNAAALLAAASHGPNGSSSHAAVPLPDHLAVAAGAPHPMLRWQHEPLSASLTLLGDDRARRLAVKSFRDVLAFMGDRPLVKPLALAQELLATGLSVPELRDEILLQLAKQLTGNPSLASTERGWVLMHAALNTFPPSEELENFLELWLRERGALPCVWAMHVTLYRGGPPRGAGAPSVAELQAALERARAPALPSLVVDNASSSSSGSHGNSNSNGNVPSWGPRSSSSSSHAPSAAALGFGDANIASAMEDAQYQAELMRQLHAMGSNGSTSGKLSNASYTGSRSPSHIGGPNAAAATRLPSSASSVNNGYGGGQQQQQRGAPAQQQQQSAYVDDVDAQMNAIASRFFSDSRL